MKDVRISEIIEHALELWESSDNWIQGTDAARMRPSHQLDADFIRKVVNPENIQNVKAALIMMERPQACSPYDEEATKWCAQGVIARSISDLTGQQASLLSGTSEYSLQSRTMAVIGEHIDEEWYNSKIDEWKRVHATTCAPYSGNGKCSHLDELLETRPKSVVPYNDDKEHTFEDVRLLFKKALHSITE